MCVPYTNVNSCLTFAPGLLKMLIVPGDDPVQMRRTYMDFEKVQTQYIKEVQLSFEKWLEKTLAYT